jgi:RecB family endonuclease NucS
VSKYGKPIWQHVFEAAKGLKVKTFSPMDIIRKIHVTDPEIPSGTIRSYVIAMAPNHPSSGHHPSTRRLHGFFEYLGNGRFRIKEQAEIETEASSEETEIEEGFEEAAISLEGDLETFILKDLTSIEEGLHPYRGESGQQFSVESGRIDILAEDKEGSLFVIELKAGTASDSVLAQLLGYMADVKKLAVGKGVRGIVIAYDFSNRLISAVSLVKDVSLMRYQVRFKFERVA